MYTVQSNNYAEERFRRGLNVLVPIDLYLVRSIDVGLLNSTGDLKLNKTDRLCNIMSTILRDLNVGLINTVLCTGALNGVAI